MPEPLLEFIAERLLVSKDGEPRLIGGRDRATGRLAFPAPSDEERFEPILLPARGRLWSWTVQRFRPKSPPYAGPETFEPYAVGYVALEDAIIVEGRLTDVTFDALHIGIPMRLVTLPFNLASGEVRLTFAFAPDAEAAA